MHIGYWWEIQKERDHLEDQDVGGWTILKWILERYDGMVWTDLAQDRDQWRALVKTAMNFGFHKMLGSSRVAAQLAASQEGLSSRSE
jgi:hypothetical protein